MKNKLPIWAEDKLDELILSLQRIIQENQRPAKEVILDDQDALSMLKICKRSLASLRSDGLLKFSKVKGKIYYRLSDLLELIDSNKVSYQPATSRSLNFKSTKK